MPVFCISVHGPLNVLSLSNTDPCFLGKSLGEEVEGAALAITWEQLLNKKGLRDLLLPEPQKYAKLTVLWARFRGARPSFCALVRFRSLPST